MKQALIIIDIQEAFFWIANKIYGMMKRLLKISIW